MGELRSHLRTPARSICVLWRTLRSEEAGAEMLEFALLLPLLLTLTLGIVWMGRAFNIYQTITRAAREGAAYGVLPNCATCGNAMADTYSASNTCLTNPTNVFTNQISPALQASGLDPAKVRTYCQEAEWLDASSNGTVDSNMDKKAPTQCGVVISFTYPVKLTIPFTTLNATTLNIPTQVRMRMENQDADAVSGNPLCP
jgi:Flp pilus assembly protein TadG